MVAKKTFDGKLQQIDHKFRMFGRTEFKHLRRILDPGEKITQSVYGHYQGGSGLLAATDKRVILIDKRPFYLYVEDHSYDSVSSVDFVSRMLQGVLYFQAGAKRIIFTSVYDARLLNLQTYVQGKITTVYKPIITIKDTSIFNRKPYLNPAWRPHHTTALRRPRLSKFPAGGATKSF